MLASSRIILDSDFFVWWKTDTPCTFLNLNAILKVLNTPSTCRCSIVFFFWSHTTVFLCSRPRTPLKLKHNPLRKSILHTDTHTHTRIYIASIAIFLVFLYFKTMQVDLLINDIPSLNL